MWPLLWAGVWKRTPVCLLYTSYPVVHGMHPTVRIEIGGRVFISVDTHLFIQPDELEEGSENHFIARNIRVEPKVRIENPLAGDILTPVNSHVRLRTVVVPEGRMVLQLSLIHIFLSVY